MSRPKQENANMSDVHRLSEAGYQRALDFTRRCPQAAHVMPLFETVRCGAVLGLIAQHVGPWRMPSGYPALVVVGDDMETSYGLAAFHLPSLRRVLKRASHVAVHSGAAEAKVYAAAAAAVLLTRRPVVLVETTERHEADWLDFVRRAAPRAAHLLVTPLPEATA